MILKIMYFLDEGLGFGGAAHTLLRQAVLMKNAGHEVVLSISDYKNETIAEEYFRLCAKKNIEIVRMPFVVSSQPEDIDIISVIKNYRIVRDIVKRYSPDLLHSIQINPIVELTGRELKIPHIMNIYQIQREFFSVPYTDIFPRYHICDSRYYADIWKELIHTDSICIRTAAEEPMGNRMQRSRDGNGRVRYCCVGGVCVRKNQLEVIKAFELALAKGVDGELFLYGYDMGPYAKACRHYLEQKNLGELIHMVGFCTNMEDEYEKADVLLCGSTCESYPNVISEAMAHGLVIISTPVAGVPEVIEDGYNGYLCDGYSDSAIARKILQFERERKAGRTTQILSNASDTYRKLHSSKSVRLELERYYGHVLEDFHEPPPIRIEGICERFSDMITLYNGKKDTILHPELVRLKLWYVYHIKEVLEKLATTGKRQAYIWGAGRLANTIKVMIETFFPFLQLKGFIDSYKQGELLNLPICHPDAVLRKENMVLFVGLTNGQEEILRILEEQHKIYNQDYFVLTPRTW
ncbi:MAG: glycosyltransferase family 4 protein [Lachnospiraceae bacterium]|nr:glycosyltransferase family 4 protein [Lachnospiraceae bacterium]